MSWVIQLFQFGLQQPGQLVELDFQCAAKVENGIQGWGFVATLKQTDVRPIYTSLKAQLFLRDAPSSAQLGQHHAECMIVLFRRVWL